jgi:hypothetical protein
MGEEVTMFRWEDARNKRIKEYALEHVLDLETAEKRLDKEDKKKVEDRKKKEKEHSLKAQRAYRERHGEDLKKARRVAYALMSLRKEPPRSVWGSRSTSAEFRLFHLEGRVCHVAEALSAFMLEIELKFLMRELSGEAAKERSRTSARWSKSLAAGEKRDKKKYEAAMRKIEGTPSKKGGA